MGSAVTGKIERLRGERLRSAAGWCHGKPWVIHPRAKAPDTFLTGAVGSWPYSERVGPPPHPPLPFIAGTSPWFAGWDGWKGTKTV